MKMTFEEISEDEFFLTKNLKMKCFNEKSDN